MTYDEKVLEATKESHETGMFNEIEQNHTDQKDHQIIENPDILTSKSCQTDTQCDILFIDQSQEKVQYEIQNSDKFN